MIQLTITGAFAPVRLPAGITCFGIGTGVSALAAR